jgi:hypothetical protein
MVNITAADWGRFLQRVGAPEGVPHQVTLEVAEITSTTPLALNHRGVVSSAGVTAADHVTPAAGPCLVAVLSGASNLTTGLRVVVATF